MKGTTAFQLRKLTIKTQLEGKANAVLLLEQGAVFTLV